MEAAVAPSSDLEFLVRFIPENNLNKCVYCTIILHIYINIYIIYIYIYMRVCVCVCIYQREREREREREGEGTIMYNRLLRQA